MQTTQYLKPFLAPWINIADKDNVKITGLSADSRTIVGGDLFFALSSHYIQTAIQKGAAAIITAHPLNDVLSIPHYYLPNLQQQLGFIASAFYQHPSKQLKIIGITGTSGKTSCTQFIAQSLALAEISTAVIGSLGYGKVNHLQPGEYTTPDALTLQKLLAQFRDQGIKNVVMEVSSHGLDQGRVNGIDFFIGGFTNLSHEHLDYHHTLANYAQAKKRLFQLPLRYGILNGDDDYGLPWLQEFSSVLPVYGISTAEKLPLLNAALPWIHASHILTQQYQMIASIHSPWGDGVLPTPLLGKFNISNLLMALAALNLCDISFTESLHYLSQLKNPPGRMECLGGQNKHPLIIIDYAHKPEALRKVLQTARAYCQGKLWCVFGCGGNRDRTKRAMMATIAEQFADEIIVTDDNPRHENPQHIVAEIMQGFAQPQQVIIEHNRRLAIAHAIASAHIDDVIVIAGKGHETYQLIGDEKLPFSDILTAKMLLLPP